MTKTTVEVSPGPSLPTTFSAQISQPAKPQPAVMPPVALVEIVTAAELIPGPPGSPDTGPDILIKLAPVDGAGSGLDSDLLDGQDGAFYLARANHTGEQAIATVTGLQAALDAKVDDSEYTAADVMAKVQSVDGAGSGLDADLLDGQQGTFYTSLANQTGTISDAQHGNRAGGSLHALVGAAAGFMSAADKTKLDTVATGAIGEAPNDGTQYVRKNLAWDPVDVPPGTYIGDTPPAGPDPGQLWWESDSGKLYIWFNDGTSSQWVQVNAAGGGDVFGPASATDSYFPVFSGTSGKLLKSAGGVYTDASNNLLALGRLYAEGATAWVGASYLKLTYGTFNYAIPLGLNILPGGYVCLAPTCWANASEGHIAGPLFASNAATPGTLVATGPTGGGNINYFTIGRQASGTVYAETRYFGASPPYDMGDGEVPLFVFALIEKGTGYVCGAWAAPDPPWAYNGPTKIVPDVFRNGKGYRRIKDVKLDKLSPREAMTAYHEAPIIEVEVDMAMKMADMPLIPHPYISDPMFVAGEAEVVLLDPMADMMPMLAGWVQSGEHAASVLDLIHKDGKPSDLLFGNEALKRAGPPGLMVVAPRWR